MKSVDFSLFTPQPFEFTVRGGRKYQIEFIPAQLELTAMQEQGNVAKKLSDWSKLDGNDLERWKNFITKVLKEQKNPDIDQNDINKMSPMELLAIMTSIIQYLNERSQIIKQTFPDEVKTEIDRVEDDLKKKMIEQA